MINELKNTEFKASGDSSRTFVDKALCLALDVGEGMLKNGDNVHHVEDTIKRICRAYGGVHIEAFVISSLILASLRMEDGSYSSQIRRLYDTSNNMSAIENFNSLSRKICAETPDFDVAQAMLKETKTKKTYPIWLSFGGSMLAAGAFSILFGGSIRDGLAGAVIGLIIAALSQINLVSINALSKTLIVSFAAGIASYLTVLIGLGQNVDMVMIGSIMLLIPGLALGNALRDLLSGDILTGVLKTVQSCLSAMLIACGYAGAMLVMSGVGVETGLPAIKHSFIISLIVAILGTVAFAAVFRVRKSCLWITAIGGGAVYAVYCLCEYLGAHVFLCAFFCAVFGAAYSEVCARLAKVPAIVFLTPAIISIVPGGALYYTMSAIVSGDNPLFLIKATQTLFIGAGLVVGTLFVNTVMSAILARKMKKK